MTAPNNNNQYTNVAIMGEGWITIAAGALFTLVNPFVGTGVMIFGGFVIAVGYLDQITGGLINSASNEHNISVSPNVTKHDYLINSVRMVETTGISDTQPLLDIKNDGSSVAFNGKTLIGASKYPTEAIWKNGNITYQLNGTDLTVQNGNDELTITNFHNGDLGIHLKMEEPTPPRTYTTEEVNAKWYNILGFWQASNYPANSSYGSITFDTLSWNIGLTNLEPDPLGKGKWVPTFVLGNVPNLSCPIVPFDNIKILEFNKTLTQVA